MPDHKHAPAPGRHPPSQHRQGTSHSHHGPPPSRYPSGPPPQYPPPSRKPPPRVSSQPLPKPTMLAVKGGGGGNRNAKGLPIGPDGQRPWSHGLCTCTEDCGLFCRACCDPCVIYGRNKQRYEHLHLYGVPDPQNGKGDLGDDACQRHAWITCFFGSGWLFQIPLRGKLRKRYGIRGSCMGDCCSSSFCQPCALAQESRELALEEESRELALEEESLRARAVV